MNSCPGRLVLTLLITLSTAYLAGAGAGGSDEGTSNRLQFISEPVSQLSRADGSRVTFKCNASPPEATIKWLRNGSIIKNDDHEWIKVNGNKLILKLHKSFHGSNVRNNNNSQSAASSNEVYQCLAELGSQRIVSQPAKLIIAELNPFEAREDNQDTTVTVIAGNTAVIPCQLPQGVPFVISEFEFNNITIAQSYDRYRLVPSGSLQILQARATDSGAYRCVANNPFLQEKMYAHHSVKLKVVRARNLPHSDRNLQFEVTPKKVTSSILGQNITIECVAKGHPPPKIYWERTNGQLPKLRNAIDGGNLHITILEKVDEGTYVCRASNGKATIRASTSLEVSEIPQIVNSEPYEVLEVGEGEDLHLPCEARGFPRPFITWLHNGYIINIDMEQTLKNTYAFNGDDTVLMIRRANSSHSGIYQCFATNQLGSTYSIKMVTVRSAASADSARGGDPFPTSGFPVVSHPRHRTSQTAENKPSIRDEGEDVFLNNDDDATAGEVSFDGANHNIDQQSPNNNSNSNKPKKRKNNRKLIPPNNPVVSALNEDSVMVRWTVSKHGGLRITFFKVQFREAGKNEVNTVDEEIPAHIFSYSVSGLNPKTKYRFRIAAVYENNDNAKSNWTKFHFPRDSDSKRPFAPPTIKSAVALSQSEISLHWELINFDGVPIDGFFIYYRPSDSAGEYLKGTALGAETRDHTLSHLVPGMMYEIKMRSFNPSGTSDFSNIYTIKTLPPKDITTTPTTEATLPTRPTPPDSTWPYLPTQIQIVIGALALAVFVVFVIICVIRCKNQSPVPKVVKKGKPLKTSSPSDYYFNSTKVYDRRSNGQLAAMAAASRSNNSLKPPISGMSEMEAETRPLNLRLNPQLSEMSSLNRKNSFRSSLSSSTHHLFNGTNGRPPYEYAVGHDAAPASATSASAATTVSTATIDRKRMMKSCVEPYLDYPRSINHHHSASFTRLNGTLERKRRSRTDLNTGTLDRSYLRNIAATSEMDRPPNGNAGPFLGPQTNGPIVIMQSSC